MVVANYASPKFHYNISLVNAAIMTIDAERRIVVFSGRRRARPGARLDRGVVRSWKRPNESSSAEQRSAREFVAGSNRNSPVQ